jgi:hypothetical protein
MTAKVEICPPDTAWQTGNHVRNYRYFPREEVIEGSPGPQWGSWVVEVWTSRCCGRSPLGSGLDLLNFNLGNVAASQLHTTKAELLGPGSGGPGSGHYRATIQIPQGSAAGVWSASVFARDELSNYSQTSAPLTVVDRNPITARPDAVDASLTPGASALAQTVTVHLTSARVAITGADVEVHGPSQQCATYYLALIGGTNLDGVWTGTVQRPALGLPGTSMSMTNSGALRRSLTLQRPAA